jgi:enediyne biosynthesis protein E4
MARFADATDRSGIDFQYAASDFTGGALAVADLDHDGLPDIVASRQLGGLRLFRNLGGLRFEEVADSGLDDAATTGIAAVDLDNDGDLDLVLAGLGSTRIMANRGDGTFVEAARLEGSGTTQHVLPVDLDGDGLLDLYFSNHDLEHPGNAVNRLYMNRGGLQFAAGGTFGGGQSWSASAFDVDGDGDQDVYVAHDTLLADFGGPVTASGAGGPDLLLRNDGKGADGVVRFTEIAAAMGLAEPRSSMGGLVADFDSDGRFDVYIPNFGAKKLFLGTPGPFVEAASALGVVATERRNATCPAVPDTEECLLLSWSAALSDFDLDGYDELLLVNGLSTTSGTAPPVLMFTRGPELAFHEVSPELPCMDARGLVVTDLDGDGDQDIVIAQQTGPLLVYENLGTPAPGTSLRVTLHGSTSNREGLGAIVTIHMQSGRTQRRIVGAGGVLNTSSPAEAFFGVGADRVLQVIVDWPSGLRSAIDVIPGTVTAVIDEPR